MAAPVLVAYATRSGSTREVAETIAATLREHGLDVRIQPVKEVGSLSGYHALVFGAPLIMGRWHKDARRFLSRHHEALEACTAAVFALGPVHDTEEEWRGVRDQLDKTLGRFPRFQPIAIEVFGGKFDLSLLGFPWKLLPRLKKIPPSDIRDWAAISAWAGNLAEKFRQEPPPNDTP
jgi:menaquinone-dependent protoporphyrinogen oxidase